MHAQAGEEGALPHCKVGSETEPLGAGTVEAQRSLTRGWQLEVCSVFAMCLFFSIQALPLTHCVTQASHSTFYVSGTSVVT